MRRLLVLVMAMTLAGASAAPGALLCQKPSGALFAREACKKKETAVDPAALGLVGPKGDAGTPGAPGEARAFACADASADGTLVVPCVGRPTKNVTSVVKSTANDGTTCFVLDPSIPADSAVAIASFSDPFYTSAVNAIINVIATTATFTGCPANSVAVTTGRYRQADPGLGMDFELRRLGVSIAVM
jgi:hypothetical protein